MIEELREARCTILLVDDHRDVQEMMKGILERRGYEVVVAGSVATALDVIASRHVDVVISDLRLPDGSGYALASRLAEMGIVAIALTGSAAAEDAAQSREAGFLEHLTKPVDLTRLESTIVRARSLRPSNDDGRLRQATR